VTNAIILKRLLVCAAVVSLAALTYVATTSGNTSSGDSGSASSGEILPVPAGVSGTEAGGSTTQAGSAPQSAPANGNALFAALRRPQVSADLGFAADPNTQPITATGKLVSSGSRRVWQGPDGASAWLVPSASGDVCFVAIDATGLATTVCVHETWAATHGGFGVMGGSTAEPNAPTSMTVQGVLPDGSHGVNITSRDGRTVPVTLNSDNAYSVAVPGVPAQMTYLDHNGTQNQHPYPATEVMG
jgi:hypothetical protein